MKTTNILSWTLLLGFTFTLILSCQKSGVKTSNAGTTDSSTIFSATIAGTAWIADSVTGILLVDGDKSFHKLTTISGFTADKIISITLNDTSFSTSADSSISLKQYTVGGWPVWAGFSYASGKTLVRRDSVWTSEGISYNGEATVTADDATNKKVSGTFAFTAVVVSRDSNRVVSIDTLDITNGVFKNIPYVYKRRQ